MYVLLRGLFVKTDMYIGFCLRISLKVSESFRSFFSVVKKVTVGS